MNSFEAIILGIIQGLTEFLPVSSSGHLVIAKNLFGIETHNLSFEVAVHAATVMSTIVVFRKEIWDLLKGLFMFKYNSQTEYVFKILVSVVPVMLVGLFFKDFVERIFGSGLLIVGIALLITSALLYFSDRSSSNPKKEGGKEIGYKEAFIIGLSQAVAVIPGLSRSGTTISTGLFLGVKRSEVAKFSFLMVLIPILGEAFLELVSGDLSAESSGIATLPLVLGTLAAFISGFIACSWMINVVKRAKLKYFALYCVIIGVACIISAWI